MPIPKRPRPPAHQNQPSPKSKPEQLGTLESSRLRRLGRRDGQRCLPKQDESGDWISPALSKKINAYNEFCIFKWSELQSEHENNYKEITRICQEIPVLEEQLETHRQSAPPPADLTERIKGEENLSEPIITNRRQREHEKRHLGYFSRLRQLESRREENYRQLMELSSVIQSTEKTVRMACEQAAGIAEQRILAYWNGMLQTHQKFKILPPTPVIVLESNAETEYYAQNNQIKGDVKQILARRQYGDTAANIQRMEEDYVSEQKQR